ncbi:hypothetical protein SEA_IDYN_81 [Gordonia phage IDyn]|uniref:Uncharacterized protein n=1 Tax=Gordonia phage IDyn TaxID=2510506 RepID=A0A411CUB7_9CAUD|nr:hypothetical protein KNU47_gp81 [Gordonia phage IDyn]QAY17429.1 hypothetical protein SEA_IDYN_81 [Gordonia phage IDyn]
MTNLTPGDGVEIDDATVEISRGLCAAFPDVSAADVVENLAAMSHGYLLALLWTQQTGDGADLDDRTLLDAGWTVDDVDTATRERVTRELREVVETHPLAVRMYGAQRRHNAADGSVWEHFGHDLLLTRDQHGAGFWDRGLGDLGDYLTAVADGYGEHDELYPDTVGPNGEELLTDGEGPTCERHGGPWGGDETCELCTDDDGRARPS